MNWRFAAGDVVNASIRVIDPDVFGAAAGVPDEKDTRPAMMMHRLSGSRGNDHLQHTHDCIFKQNLVTLGRNLYRVVALGETGLVLRVESQRAPHELEDRKGGDSREKQESAPRRERFVWLHGLKYTEQGS